MYRHRACRLHGVMVVLLLHMHGAAVHLSRQELPVFKQPLQEEDMLELCLKLQT